MPRIVGRNVVLGPVTALTLVSCFSPVETGVPELPELPVAAGLFVLAAHSVPEYPGSGCEGTGTFAGVAITSVVTLTRAGDTVVVRSASELDGDLEIRIRAHGMFYGSTTVIAEASGTAIDRRTEVQLGIGTMSFGEGTTASLMTGTVLSGAPPDYLGSMVGPITTTTSIGTGTCPRGSWRVREPGPGEMPDSRAADADATLGDHS